MNMNKKKIMKIACFLGLLLQLNYVKGYLFDPLRDIKQEISIGMPINNYYKKVLNVVENEKEWFVDFARYKIHEPCNVFKKKFAVFFDVYNEKVPELHEKKYEKFFELILPLAAQSGKCWFFFIEKVKKLDTASYWFLRMAHAALQDYVYSVIENKKHLLKIQKYSWPDRYAWHIRMKIFLRISDFELIAAMENLKEVDKDAYNIFMDNLTVELHKYLKNIPNEFRGLKLKFTNKEINDIAKMLRAKLNPSRLRRFFRLIKEKIKEDPAWFVTH
jgi:hypothetical protein